MIDSDDVLKALRPRLRRFVAEGGDAAIHLIVRWTGFKIDTVGGWLALETPPAQPLIKLWHLLDLMGFDSPEVAGLEPYQRLLGQLYAVGLVDNAGLLETLKVKNVQTAVQIMRGQKAGKFDVETDLPTLQQTYGAALEKKVAELPKVATAEFPVTVAMPTQAAPEESGDGSDRPTVSLHSAVPDADLLSQIVGDPAAALSVLLGIVFPLASRLVLEGSPEDRARFRQLLGMPDVVLLAETVRLLDALRTRATYVEYMRERP